MTHSGKDESEISESDLVPHISNFRDSLPASLQVLATLSAGAASTLVALAEDPVDFIVGTVLETFVGFVLGGFGWLIGQFEAALRPVARLPITIATPIFEAGRTLMGPVFNMLAYYNVAIETTVAAAGPLGPLVSVLFTAVTMIVVLWVIQTVFTDILPLVIPWL